MIAAWQQQQQYVIPSMQGSPFPRSVDGLRRGSSGTASISGSSLSWVRAPANDDGLPAPLLCCLINTQDALYCALDSQEPAAQSDLHLDECVVLLAAVPLTSALPINLPNTRPRNQTSASTLET